MIRLRTVTALLMLCAAAWPAIVSAETAGAAADATPVVEIDGERLDMEAAMRPFALQILRLESQAYALRRRAIDDAVAKRLIEREAAARSMTTQALLAQEVDAKIVQPTEAEVDALAARRGGAAGTSAADIAETRLAIRASLVEQRRAEQRTQFVASLRTKAAITIEGLEPPVLRTAIPLDGEPSLGPADAPVTIVEFSDFQCPHCRQVQGTLKALLRRYAGKVRFVHRDYPVAQLHPGAAAAAEAARCAGEQDKFWPYHDLLYANPTRQAEGDLARYADEMGLDGARFRDCVRTRRYAGAVARGLADGRSLGVVGTPTFFVNGVPLIGARPVSEFVELIERDLRRREGTVDTRARP